MEEKEDLFKVQLNEEGVRSVFRIHRIVNACFWVGSIVNLAMLYVQVRAFIGIRSILNMMPFGSRVKIVIEIIYILIFTIVYFLQFFYFLKYTRGSKKAIALNDSFTFNRSLSWMYKAFWMTTIAVLINGIYAVYNIIGT